MVVSIPLTFIKKHITPLPFSLIIHFIGSSTSRYHLL